MDREDILCLDNGIYKLWFARSYATYAENTVLLDNALASMGAGLPSAIAAKLVHPEKTVISICGDGGFMMTGQELTTAAAEGLKTSFVKLVEDRLGISDMQALIGDIDRILDLIENVARPEAS